MMARPVDGPSVGPSRPRMAGTVLAALVIAGTALVVATAFEAAFWIALANAVDAYEKTVTGGSKFCDYAFRGSGPATVGNTWLCVVASFSLLIGGVVSLVLALVRPSRGSRRRRWAIGGAVAEIALAGIVYVGTAALIVGLIVQCYD